MCSLIAMAYMRAHIEKHCRGEDTGSACPFGFATYLLSCLLLGSVIHPAQLFQGFYICCLDLTDQVTDLEELETWYQRCRYESFK